jgi:hypothetical protein
MITHEVDEAMHHDPQYDRIRNHLVDFLVARSAELSHGRAPAAPPEVSPGLERPQGRPRVDHDVGQVPALQDLLTLHARSDRASGQTWTPRRPAGGVQCRP